MSNSCPMFNTQKYKVLVITNDEDRHCLQLESPVILALIIDDGTKEMSWQVIGGYAPDVPAEAFGELIAVTNRMMDQKEKNLGLDEQLLSLLVREWDDFIEWVAGRQPPGIFLDVRLRAASKPAFASQAELVIVFKHEWHKQQVERPEINEALRRLLMVYFPVPPGIHISGVLEDPQ